MGPSLSRLRPLRVHHLGNGDPKIKIEDKIISLARSIKTMVDVSTESKQASNDSQITQINRHITKSIKKTLQSMILLIEMSSYLDGRVLNEYLTACLALRHHIPIIADALNLLIDKVRMMLEDKTEDNSDPIILRISEINKILKQARHSVRLSLSRRISSTTLVIQRQTPPTEDGDTRLKRLFIVNDMNKKMKGDMDYGFFDGTEETSPEKSQVTSSRLPSETK